MRFFFTQFGLLQIHSTCQHQDEFSREKSFDGLDKYAQLTVLFRDADMLSVKISVTLWFGVYLDKIFNCFQLKTQKALKNGFKLGRFHLKISGDLDICVNMSHFYMLKT